VLTNLTGDVPAGIEALQQALTLARGVDDPQEQGLVLLRLGPLLGRMGRLDECESALQGAAALLQHGPDTRVHANALVNLGFLAVQRNDPAAAVPLLLQARALYDGTKHRLDLLNCESNLALAWAALGQTTQALALVAHVAQRLDPATDGFQWADQLLTTGRVQLLCGQPGDAVQSLREGLAYARAQGLRAAEIDLMEWLAQALQDHGNLAEALQTQRELRAAERRWHDEQSANRLRVMQAGIDLAAQRAENHALARARDELEQRVTQRTQALQVQIQEREAAEALARYWSDHDWLTRLPNRRLLQAQLALGLEQAKGGGTPLAVAFIDLDGFKSVNDAHGHEAGDRALRTTARRLVRHAPRGATVARYGGDEFVVLLTGPDAHPAKALAAAQRLRVAVQAPLRLSDRRVQLTCSLGIALAPRDADTPDALLRSADRAMLQAKAAGRNQVHELTPDGQERLDRRSRLRRDLGQALANGSLSAAFQPLVDLRTGQMAGVELLARWPHPELGLVSPDEFVPVAEESGLVGALGLWALGQATRAAVALHGSARWPEGQVPRVGLNLSSLQLADTDLVSKLVTGVQAEGGQPPWLELELTESMQLAEDPGLQARLRQLREAGFHLALDDFGAGYSSFSVLSRIYFDRLKIDRALVQAALQAPGRRAVTGSIIAMAHGLGLQVVAEGIETAEQRSLLQRPGLRPGAGLLPVARPHGAGARCWRGGRESG
jgi:diguanylate cyclase (GGDEF)-like protein